MNRVRIIFVLFVLLAVCAAIAGCTTNSSPAPSASVPAPVSTPSAGTVTGGGQTVTVNLVARNIAFDRATISVPAGAHVVMVFDNQDGGVVHNFALYTDSSAKTKLFAGEFITGPKQITYTFDAPSVPGTYFFRCDVHPTTMTGTFTVT